MIQMKREKSVFMFREAKLILGLLLSFMGVMFLILPITSHASQQSDPVEIEIGFKNQQPRLNSPETLFLRLHDVTHGGITDVTVNVSLPEEVRLIRGDTSWRGDINKGETVEISMIVEIVETGRYSIGVVIDWDPAAHVHIPSYMPGAGSRLNIIATDEEVRASTASFWRMDFERATPEERKKLMGGPGISVPTPPRPAPMKPTLPELLRQKEDDSKGTDEELIEGSDIGVEETITVTVSGTMI